MTAEAKPENAQAADYGRPVAIEELSNRWIIHPISGIVERFAIKWRISANVISFMGLAAGLIAALLYYYQDHRAYVIGGFLFMVLWHVFDGADGRVARATGTSSAFGRVIDGICDHLVFGAVYFAFVFYLLKTGSPSYVWFLAIGAAASHGLQAAGYEERRQKYQRRLRGVARSVVNDKLLQLDGGSSWLAKAYDKAQRIVSGGHSPLDQMIEYNRRYGAAEAEIVASIQKTSFVIRAWALLNANNRTIMLAAFALAQKPSFYFIYEIVILNLCLVGLILFEKSTEERIVFESPLGFQPTS